MADLNRVIRDVWQSFDTVASGLDYNSLPDRCPSEPRYMEIPVQGNCFEVPVFALRSYVRYLADHPDVTKVVAKLVCVNYTPRYKTVSRYMCDILRMDSTYKLVKLTVDGCDEPVVYYGTQGLILNSSFEPVVTCSWLVQRFASGYFSHRLVRPLLRIHPECLTYQDDAMQKFIAKKLLGESLCILRYTPPPAHSLNPHIEHSLCDEDLLVEIDKSPFSITGVTPPTFDTTDQTLLQTVRDHIGEVVL